MEKLTHSSSRLSRLDTAQVIPRAREAEHQHRFFQRRDGEEGSRLTELGIGEGRNRKKRPKSDLSRADGVGQAGQVDTQS